MKTLTIAEVETVSGAGKFADAIVSVGTVIGFTTQVLGLGNKDANVGSLATDLGVSIESAFKSIKNYYKALFT